MNRLSANIRHLWIAAIAVAAAIPVPTQAINLIHAFAGPSGMYWFCDFRTAEQTRTFLIKARSAEHARQIAPLEQRIEHLQQIRCY